MDTIDDVVTRCRPALEPDPVIVARDRDRVRALISDAPWAQPDAEHDPVTVVALAARSTSAGHDRHRRVGVGVAAAALVAAGSAAILTVRADQTPDATGSAPIATPATAVADTAPAAAATSSHQPTTEAPSPQPPTGLDALVYPAADSMRVETVHSYAFPTGRHATVLVDPNGDAKAVAVSENFHGDRGPSGQRDLAGLSVWHANEDGNAVYGVTNPCSMFTINDGEHSAVWDPTIIELFDHVSIQDPVATLEVPAGWHDLTSGPLTSLFELQFSVTIDDGTHRLQLLQMPGTTVGALASQRSLGTATPIDVGGTAGWVFATADTRYLVWDTGPGAAMIGGPASLNGEPLAEIAVELESGRADLWSTILGQPDGQATVTTVNTGPVSTAGCAAVPELYIQH